MNDKITNNNVFFENLKSLIRLAKDSQLNIELQKSDFNKKLATDEVDENWIDESAHLANADWILLNSIFVSMFSHLEYKFFLYCKLIERNSAFQIKLEHLSGSTLIKYFNYLHFVAGINSADKNSIFYQNLILFQKTRNTLVHNGGLMITDKNKTLKNHELYSFLKTRNVVMAGSLGIIRITNTDFIEDFYSNCEKLCELIAEEINKNFR